MKKEAEGKSSRGRETGEADKAWLGPKAACCSRVNKGVDGGGGVIHLFPQADRQASSKFRLRAHRMRGTKLVFYIFCTR